MTTTTTSKMSQTMFDIDTDTYNEQKIKNKSYSTSNAVYQILNYDKDILCDDDEINSVYRSIVIDPSHKNILCFSPPKSIPIDSFVEKYPELNDKILVNEIIEGTMINLFYDKRIESWEISSRSAIGGNYWYFRNHYDNIRDSDSQEQLTFRDMFVDAFRVPINTPLNSIPALQEFNKSYCYSFVLQHPENHIVLAIQRPKLYLVAVYELFKNNKVSIVSLSDSKAWVDSIGLVEFPNQYDISGKSYTDMENSYCTLNNSYNSIGLMYTHLETGERSQMLNPSYDNMKKIRGNNPNLQYQYLALYRTGKVKEFLNFFPRYKKLFYQFYQQSNNFIKTVHDAYVMYYVKKRGKEITISKPIFKHIYKLHHELYLPSIAVPGEKLIITRQMVANYFNKMEPKEMLYHLNYEKRVYAKDNEPKDVDQI
jgi:hypothetical protein